MFFIGRVSTQGDKEATDDSLRAAQRNNRLLRRAAIDLGVFTKKSMKSKRASSKSTKKTVEAIVIPDSTSSHPPTSPIPTLHGTPLTFRSPKYSTRFQNLMINKNIVYGKPVDPVLFHQIGVATLFENVGLVAMLSPSKSAYLVLNQTIL